MSAIYRVNSIFSSVQGEGCWMGTPAIFLRLAGCNLWNGIEEARESADCRYCDTDFRHGNRSSAEDIANEIRALRHGLSSSHVRPPLLVITGGEPMLQLDGDLAGAIRARNEDMRLHLETNGTIEVPAGLVDWITVSPKVMRPLKQRTGNELKVVWPQHYIREHHLELWASREFNFEHYWISPCWSGNVFDRERNAREARDAMLRTSVYRLTTQAHKQWGFL